MKVRPNAEAVAAVRAVRAVVARAVVARAVAEAVAKAGAAAFHPASVAVA